MVRIYYSLKGGGNMNTVGTVRGLFGAGLVCLDIIKTDKKTYYYNGGSCGNIVAALSLLGWRNAVLVDQYKDEAAKILNHNLKLLGVKRIELAGSSFATPRIVEELSSANGGIHRFLLSCPKCGSQLPRLRPLREKAVRDLELNGFNVFYTDRSSRGIACLRKIFKAKGSWAIYEPNSSRNLGSLITNALNSHIVKFSSEKVSATVADNLRDKAISGSLLLIVRTLGKEGLVFSYRYKGNKMSKWIHMGVQHAPSFVDAAGAGDWCTAGLLYSLIGKYEHPRRYLVKEDVKAALHYGQALAAISCGFVGAQGLIYADVGEDIEQSLLGTRNRASHKGIIPAEPPININNDFCDFCLLKKPDAIGE